MPKAIFQETMCCGHKKCPTVTVFEDGSLEISDNDKELGSEGTIKLDPERVARLKAILSERQK